MELKNMPKFPAKLKSFQMSVVLDADIVIRFGY